MMTDSTIAFIGLGLIGGSIARGIKRANPDTTIMAYMRTRSRLEQAKADGIVDVILDGIGEELRQCDLIFLCTPVEYNAQYLSSIRPYLKPGALLTDVGSTKTDIHEAVTRLGMEQVFVGGHPMAGSEKTGYENSTDHLLENAYYIITPTAASSNQDVERLVDVANTIGSIPIVLDYHYHDQVTAAISHLPHIVASSLVNLVKDSDGKDGMMKRLAAGGFKDITRVASSDPTMWENICVANRNQILELIDTYVKALQQTRNTIAESHPEEIKEFFSSAKEYRDSFNISHRGPIRPVYQLFCDLIDEAGGIATIATILASNNISIKNIGIIHNREFQQGVLQVEFYEADAYDHAVELLRKYHYTVYEK